VHRVVVVHGYDAAPDSHWFPWLRRRLAAEGVRTVLVDLPEPSYPETGAWLDAVGRAVGEVDEHTHLVGHSLGCITLLRHLAGLPRLERLSLHNSIPPKLFVDGSFERDVVPALVAMPALRELRIGWPKGLPAGLVERLGAALPSVDVTE